MRKTLIILFVLICSVVFGQTKTDTLWFKGANGFISEFRYSTAKDTLFFNGDTILLQNSASRNITIPTANGSSGNTTNSFQSGYTASTFDLVFLGSGGKWLEVDADTSSTCQGMIALALESKNDTEAMLVAIAGSFVKNTGWSWTVGATLYAGETLGSIQEAIPTGENAVIRVIGFAVNATTIYFNPSSDQQTTVL